MYFDFFVMKFKIWILPQAQNFEFYDCKIEKIVIGVNMFHLFKLINTIDNDDTLTIYIEESDYCDGIVHHLGLKFENAKLNFKSIPFS